MQIIQSTFGQKLSLNYIIAIHSMSESYVLNYLIKEHFLVTSEFIHCLKITFLCLKLHTQFSTQIDYSFLWFSKKDTKGTNSGPDTRRVFFLFKVFKKLPTALCWFPISHRKMKVRLRESSQQHVSSSNGQKMNKEIPREFNIRQKTHNKGEHFQGGHSLYTSLVTIH